MSCQHRLTVTRIRASNNAAEEVDETMLGKLKSELTLRSNWRTPRNAFQISYRSVDRLDHFIYSF